MRVPQWAVWKGVLSVPFVPRPMFPHIARLSNRVSKGPGSGSSRRPQRWQCPPVALGVGFWGVAPRAGAEEEEGWALPVPPLPGSCQMVATVPRHEAWLAFSRRQHPGAGAGAGEPRQPSWGGARCMVLGHLWGATLGGQGAPALPTFSLPRGRHHAVIPVVTLYFLQLGFVYEAHTPWRGNTSSPRQVFTW